MWLFFVFNPVSSFPTNSKKCSVLVACLKITICRIQNQTSWCCKLHTDVLVILISSRCYWSDALRERKPAAAPRSTLREGAGLADLTNQRPFTHLNILACQSFFPPPSRGLLSILRTRHIGCCGEVCLLFLSLRTELTERFQFLCTLFSWFAETSGGYVTPRPLPSPAWRMHGIRRSALVFGSCSGNKVARCF